MKLIAGGLLIATAIGYLAFLGASSSWQYYLSVDEAVTAMDQLAGKRVRVSGRVVAGTLITMNHRRATRFCLAGERHMLPATCDCTLPDNFGEEIDVVVEGTLMSDEIRGHKVITRCASKYESESEPSPRGTPLPNPSA